MGLPVTVSVVPPTVAVLPPFVKVSCTDDAVDVVGAVPATTMVTDVALTKVGEVANVPELAGLPTLAVKPVLMKLVPVTVMVPPMCAKLGDMNAAVGSPVTVSVLLGTV